MPRRRRAPVVLEKVEQAHIVQLARAVGCVVAVLGTVRRGSACPKCGAWVQGHMGTQQTEGVADLEIWLPIHASFTTGLRELLKWETKSEKTHRAADGGLSTAQQAYRDVCISAGVTWGSGPYGAFEQFCVARGLVKAKNVPHYRQPQSGAGSPS
jgi:hypothetical protein